MRSAIIGLISLLALLMTEGCTYMSYDDDDHGDYVKNEKNPEKTGWAQAGTLTQQDPNKTVQVQANFPQSENYTVQFGLVVPPDTSSQVEALITWTVEGNPLSRRVSVSNGLSVSGVGQAVKVVVRDVSTTGNVDYNASISVARGVRPTTEKPPTLYLGVLTLGIAGSGDFDIPLDAGAQSVYISSATELPAKISISQEDNIGGVLRQWTSLVQGWVPLEPGCTKVHVFNGSGVNGIAVYATLGIDG